jgi:hypothetical protein
MDRGTCSTNATMVQSYCDPQVVVSATADALPLRVVRGSPGRRPTWIRGEARVARGWVIIDEATAAEYVPAYDPERLGEFVVIDSPRDAARFAKRFGLLREGPRSELREPLSLWMDEVALARGALQVQIDLMAARQGTAGDAERFRERWRALLPDPASSVDDADLIADAKATVMAAVNRGLAGAALEISADSEPSRGYSVTPQFPDLLAWIYSDLALVLVEELPLARCLECGGPFVVHDGRQKYCSERHAGRARHRRFTDRRRHTATLHV